MIYKDYKYMKNCNKYTKICIYVNPKYNINSD